MEFCSTQDFTEPTLFHVSTIIDDIKTALLSRYSVNLQDDTEQINGIYTFLFFTLEFKQRRSIFCMN
jgi:hypothetical protein